MAGNPLGVRHVVPNTVQATTVTWGGKKSTRMKGKLYESVFDI